MKIIKILYTTAGALMLCACSLTPEYVKPESALSSKTGNPVKFANAGAVWKQAVPSDDKPKGSWWNVFGDAKLNAMLDECRANNPNLEALYATVEVAMAQSRATRGDLLPKAGVNASFGRNMVSENERYYMTPATYNSWATGVGLTWDLDLFGRVRAMLSAEKANAQAAMAAYQAMLLQLQGNLAVAYFSLLQSNAEISLLSETVKIRKEQVDYVSNRLNSGISTSVDLRRAQQQLSEARAQLESAKLSRALGINTIALILGKTTSDMKDISWEIGNAVPQIPSVLPSELLQRRPDIAEAERRVFAANAKVGAARAAYFPTVGLKANGGYASMDYENLFNSNSFTWGVGPSLYIPLFQGGQLNARSEAALAEYKNTVASYKATVLSAIKEVEDALARINFIGEEFKHQTESANAAFDIAQQTRLQYDEGVIDYFEVTDAQRLSLSTQLAQLRVRGDRFRACVHLISALGGGWYAAPDFEAGDKRNTAEKILATPSELFTSPKNYNNKN